MTSSLDSLHIFFADLPGGGRQVSSSICNAFSAPVSPLKFVELSSDMCSFQNGGWIIVFHGSVLVPGASPRKIRGGLRNKHHTRPP